MPEVPLDVVERRAGRQEEKANRRWSVQLVGDDPEVDPDDPDNQFRAADLAGTHGWRRCSRWRSSGLTRPSRADGAAPPARPVGFAERPRKRLWQVSMYVSRTWIHA